MLREHRESAEKAKSHAHVPLGYSIFNKLKGQFCGRRITWEVAAAMMMFLGTSWRPMSSRDSTVPPCVVGAVLIRHRTLVSLTGSELRVQRAIEWPRHTHALPFLQSNKLSRLQMICYYTAVPSVAFKSRPCHVLRNVNLFICIRVSKFKQMLGRRV